jgi:hypothetical protein
MSVVCSGGRAFADPLSTQPLIGLAAEYSSNPALIEGQPKSEANAALYLDLPVNYDLDSYHFAIEPRIRYSNQSGYSYVTSDYYHLDSSAKYIDDLQAVTLSGSFYRDSSLFYVGELVNGAGVRRDTSTVDLNAVRSLTERLQVQFDLNTSRTLYEQNSSLTGLLDYRYTTLAPVLAYALTQRDTLKIITGISRYYSLNDTTSSNSDSAELGYDRQLTELWTLSASVGYSKSTNKFNESFLGFFLGTIESAQNSTVYSASATRQGERLTFVGSASEALAPTGQAFLSRQQTISASENYKYSDRWTFTGGLSWQAISTPVIGAGPLDRRLYNVDLAAYWHWTEQWVVTLHLTHIEQHFDAEPGQPAIGPTSNGVSLQISRQFYRTNQ